MFHGVGFDSVPGQRLEEKLVRERLLGILSDQARIGSIIRDRTRIEAQTMDATTAVSCGIVDEVCDVKILAGCPIISLVFKR